MNRISSDSHSGTNSHFNAGIDESISTKNIKLIHRYLTIKVCNSLLFAIVDDSIVSFNS